MIFAVTLTKGKRKEEPIVVAINRRGKKIEESDNRKGFTLIEIIITLAIIGIVAAIATPTFQRMAINGNLKTAARDLAADFALYKGRSVAESRMFKIVLNVGSGTYDIQQCGATGSSCGGGYNSIQVKNLANISNDITFDAGGTTVTDYFFQTRGTVTNGTIVLRNGRNSTGTIAINFTGRTNVQFNLY